ncbi:MAG: DNA-directed RNA polymerase subunit omega [Proteobacteria bacterium]|nr:DNA-directed RNA polymerase subunit omega [Pseudomonadota bacterium]MBU1452836.1 DNA-directed RNA polymerase subunit omega [Pseudomonadota bacterium]MBU2469825.1 DNA-directed RNA polymerase subunit omega [Pseudomonadota bacterium]MBU2518051.1 DNA-directed RNA polymerase subunit omega [Pseudomonadota bacterium]
MARVTVEDCLKEVPNRFSLVHMTAKRVRQIREGALPMIPVKNKEVVVALREIAAGYVYPVSAAEAEKERAEAEARERDRLTQAQMALEAAALSEEVVEEKDAKEDGEAKDQS